MFKCAGAPAGVTTGNTVGGPGATPGGAAGPGPATERGPGGRVVILNALPLNALPQIFKPGGEEVV